MVAIHAYLSFAVEKFEDSDFSMAELLLGL